MNFSDPDEMRLLAGEYALGVMSSEDMSALEIEMQRNAALAAAVADWNDRLLSLSPPQAAVEPSAGLWQSIERDLPGTTPKPRPFSLSSSLWDSLSFWRASGLVGMLASALLALSLLTTVPQSRTPEYIAVLQGDNASASWIVEIRKDTVLLRPLAKMAVPAGKSLQFWTKPEGASGPTSLGLVAPDREIIVPLSKLPGISRNQLFEVTLEPEAGSPIDRPTGAILALGKAVPL